MATAVPANYPVYFAASDDNEVANWRPLAHWLMVIPHAIVANVLSYASNILVFVSWFIILFTGKMPDGMARFITMAMRYNARTYSFALGLTEQYPPFEFEVQNEDPGNYAVRLDINPALEGRNRLTVFFRIFMLIPIGLFMIVVFIAAYVVMIIAWFAVLFTGTYPHGMRNFVIGVFRAGQRFSGYANLLTDEYPPFSLD
ncbi:MAG: DUF4389 domain-containing protein [Acidimicrobiales bacterium]|nr:DUF4389 domain-containing protein [Acidimicrobiales bacterium]